MEGFPYRHGDRPLEGYTIQRAVGRGGFGEVYYAVSDAGREVALKAISGYEQIEVRGVSQCMNLKSPHLVSIFDIKQNPQGKSFVIMEYVGGPSLKELLEQSPAGLGAQKTAFFLREIAKGLSFLHERGIVHRDLKPGNIFYEDGYVKIGDYGLSKAIGVSRHSGQTITVGTVHYMAPEVGMGKYDRSIDIYALGIVLYEMLTGQVPFFGSSHGEILMKHLMSQPDLTGIEEPFATVIRRALSKDPAQRYQSAQEMVEAVFGEEHVRNSVSCFSPDSLTMVAGRVAQKAAVGVGVGGGGGAGSSGPAEGGYGTYKPPATGAGSDVWGNVAQRVEHLGEGLEERVDRWGERLGEAISRRWSGESAPAESAMPAGDASNDPLDRKQRRLLGFMAAVIVGAGTGLVANLRDGFGFFAVPVIFLGWVGLSVARRRFAGRLPADTELLRRLAFGGTAAAFICIILPVYALAANDKRIADIAFGTLAAVGVGLLLVDWWERMSAGRGERVDLGEAIGAGFVGWILCFLFDGSGLMAGGILAGISLAVQVTAPWDPVAAKQRAEKPKGRRWRKSRSDPAVDAAVPPTQRLEAPRPDAGAAAARMHAGAPPSGRRSAVPLRRLPGWIRAIFIALFAIMLGTGILLLVAAGIGNFRSDEFAIMVSFGVGLLLNALFCLFRALKQTFRSYWSGLVRPFLMLLCLQSALTSALFMGSAPRLRDDDILVGLAFIIFPTILLVVLAFIPDRAVAAALGQVRPAVHGPWRSPSGISERDAFVALMLSCGGFLGVGGLHRFYAGRYASGLLWLCTFGLGTFGTIYDLIMITLGLFRDRHGRPLRIWMGVERVPPATGGMVALPEWPMRGAGEGRGDVGVRRDAGDAAGFDAGEGGAGVQGPQARGMGHGLEGRATGEALDGGREGLFLDSRRRNTGPVFAPGLTNRWLAAPGSVLLFVALALGVLIAVDLPSLVAAGFPDASLNRELTQAFGYSQWPGLVGRIGRFLALFIGLAGTLIVLIARRRSGAAHTGRALLGAIGLLITVSTLAVAFDDIDWVTVVALLDAGKAGIGLEKLLEQIHSQPGIMSGLLFLVSSIVLAWPERRERLDVAAQEAVS